MPTHNGFLFVIFITLLLFTIVAYFGLVSRPAHALTPGAHVSPFILPNDIGEPVSISFSDIELYTVLCILPYERTHRFWSTWNKPLHTEHDIPFESRLIILASSKNQLDQVQPIKEFREQLFLVDTKGEVIPLFVPEGKDGRVEQLVTFILNQDGTILWKRTGMIPLQDIENFFQQR
jgi:hypothetical protein